MREGGGLWGGREFSTCPFSRPVSLSLLGKSKASFSCAAAGQRGPSHDGVEKRLCMGALISTAFCF